MSKITIRRGDKQFGPYQIDDVRRFYQEGRLLPSDLAWREGNPQWMPLASLIAPSVAPPPPFASDHSIVGSALAEPAIRYPKASFGKRLAALCIDTMIGMLGPVAGFLIFGMGIFGGGSSPTTRLMVLFAAWGWTIWYGFAKDGFQGGAGYGKRAMGLMVVHLPTNLPCAVGQSVVRQVVTTVLGFLGVGWVIELIITLVAEDGRRLADRAADTQVVLASDYWNS